MAMSWFLRFPKSGCAAAPEDGAAEPAIQEIVVSNAAAAPPAPVHAVSPERDLVVAYLTYAIDDVAALSPTGLRLLQMTIAALK